MRPSRPRTTPEGGHVPVLLNEVLATLAVRPGEVVVDCTLGKGGHAAELLKAIGPTGKLIGLDLDSDNLPGARERLEAVGHPFALHQLNFAGIRQALGSEGLTHADAILADLGVSSMQIDDAERGFSFVRDGPLDMRMDRTRGKTATQLLATTPAEELARAFAEYGDEPEAAKIAAAIVANPPTTTRELAALVEVAAPVRIEKPRPGVPTVRQQKLRPVARVFQALRILVNRELANLTALLRTLPDVLSPGGRVAIISFHSGEDRLVKQAFRDGLRAGVYAATSDETVRATWAERQANPRARSAKLRWAVKKQ
ncbi:MAG: 16S rRNA (cytosine(1402)-N(4))-methyltransferase RsmH [Gemmataceae bacterium]